MRLSDGLQNSLKEHLKWSKPRLGCFVSLLLALLQVKQMNLTLLVLAINDTTQLESRYRRLQRFFQFTRFDYDAIARMIMQMFGFNEQPFYLTLDRTNWKWGQKNLNILFLAVVYKGTAIPIYWLVLNKQGNSNQRERIAQMNRFISQFGSHLIQGILGDREFIGQHWWDWLHTHRIPFFMRMKASQHYLDKQGRSRAVRHLFSDLKPGNARILRKSRRVSGQAIYLSGLRLESGELLIIASNQFESKSFDIYGLRWQIETLFQCLKGRGFNMEVTRLTHYFRIKKMVALLVIGFCWAHKTGEWKHKMIKPLRVKNHGRLEKNLFRYGLDHLTDQLMSGALDALEASRLLVLFLCPPDWLEPTESTNGYGFSIVDS